VDILLILYNKSLHVFIHVCIYVLCRILLVVLYIAFQLPEDRWILDVTVSQK